MTTSNDNISTNKVPIWQKTTLSFKEAADLTGIGEKKLRAFADRNSDFVLCIDSKKRLKRQKLEDWIAKAAFI